MKTQAVALIAAVLSLLGIGLFTYKAAVLEFPLTPDETYSSWYVEARLTFDANYSLVKGQSDPNAKPVRVTIPLPRGGREFAIVDEQFVAEGYGIDLREGEARHAVFTKRRGSNEEIIYYRALIYAIDSPSRSEQKVRTPRADSSYNINRLQRGIIDEREAAPILVAINGIIKEAKDRSADQRSFMRAVYEIAEREDDRYKLIVTEAPEAIDVPSLVALLLNTVDIPARVINGVRLGDKQRHATLDRWVEVWYKDHWEALDPVTHRFGLDEPHMAWWEGNGAFYRLEGAHGPDLNLSIKRNTDNSITRAVWKSGELASTLLQFSFFKLPISTQLVFEVMLLIPLGGLIVSFLRQIVGVKTFGTFMPVLIALAFRETGLASGVGVLLIIVVLGLIIRGWFNQLQLLLVPRLGAMLTIVVLIIAFVALLAQNLGITVGLSISLFPIIVLTMVIERMSIMWDEYGPREATQIGIGSLIAAILCYLLLSEEAVMHLMFVFPELLLVVVGLNMLMGRYNGYKFTEYKRFKKLERMIRLNQDQ